MSTYAETKYVDQVHVNKNKEGCGLGPRIAGMQTKSTYMK